MRLMRWGFVIGLVLLQLVMKAPVWYAVGHVNLLGGNSNYQRAFLIDQFIRHFDSWWLVGTRDSGTWGWDMWDLANEFVAQGVTGGLATFVCFVLLIVICFRWLGKARKAVEGDPQREWVFWLFGATLFSHVVSFIGISYFDQIRMSWYALLVMISAITTPLLVSNPVPVSVSEAGSIGRGSLSNSCLLPYPTGSMNAWRSGGVPVLRRKD